MTLATIATTLAVIALVIAIAAMSLAATITKRVGVRDPIAVPPFWRRVLRIRPLPPAAEAFSQLQGRDQRVAFIANPTKAGIAEVREQALRACSIRYLPQPMWLYTSEDDPGTGQTREALEAGADVVVAVGGDGTVRAVAEALAGTGVPLGIVPIGTGNLFARNLDLPLGDIPGLLRTVLEGAEARIDVGWLDIERGDIKPGEPTRHVFLVMAGAGFDAEMVAGADDRLKRRVGWFAYFLAAVKHLGERRMTASVSVNGSEPVTGQMRTVLLANVGSLPGGFTLIPEASVTDGRLDIATLDARAGIVGWTDLFGSVVAQGAGLKQPEILKAYRASRIDHTRGVEVAIRMDQPQKVQVDGEALGRATAISARVDPGALVVRVPAPTSPTT
jgi:diacylglycerol kinase family enzyme